MKKILVLRPGALGDVLATRRLLAFLKMAWPKAALAFSAPGARGRFLARPGWADVFFAWERREVAWLFGDDNENPPRALADFFSGADLALAYFDAAPEADIHKRLARLAPDAAIIVQPPRPPEESGVAIFDWLLQPALKFAENTVPPFRLREATIHAEEKKITIPLRRSFAGRSLPDGRYAVIHPGSGSAKKNWRLENFVKLGGWLQKVKTPENELFFPGVAIVSGEADNDLGERLCQALPGSVHWHGLELEELAALLAGAALYVGNDSGVSHLAGSVIGPEGETPVLAILFGPSVSQIWAPPGALVFEAGSGMDQLGADAVCGLLGKSLGFS